MSTDQFERTKRLLGGEAMERLYRARVAVFGVGGVGGFVVEALARSGVGTLDLIDSDVVCESNINRQIIAAHSTLGRYKTEVMRERILDINPKAVVHVHNCFFLPENAEQFPFEEYDYVVDAVDTVTAKIALVLRAKQAGTPVISCMGAGNKLDPAGFKVADIYQTRICPLAKVMRRELKKRGVEALKVVYSEEEPAGQRPEMLVSKPPQDAASNALRENSVRRSTPGSIAFVPSAAGLILAGEVVRDLAWNRVKIRETKAEQGTN